MNQILKTHKNPEYLENQVFRIFCFSQFKFNLFLCENMVKLINKVMSDVAMTYYCRETDITRKEYE